MWTDPLLYKGKFDKKRNTFERWVHRKIYPYILIIGYNYEKDRIGKDKNENLIVNNATDNFGLVILASGGSSDSNINIYKTIDQVLIPTKINNKWGYKELLSNDLVIANVYDSVCFFQDTFARVKIGDKWGIINKQNDIIVTPKYDQIKPLEEGAMEIKNNGKWGYLDSLACEVIPCIYDEAYKSYHFRKGYKKVNQDGFVGLLDKDFKLVLPCEYGSIEQSWHNRNLFIIKKYVLEGLANGSGVICPPMFKKLEILSENEYPDILAVVTTFDDKTYYLDSQGYLYLPKRANFFKNQFIGSPNYESKFHYSELNGN